MRPLFQSKRRDFDKVLSRYWARRGLAENPFSACEAERDQKLDDREGKKRSPIARAPSGKENGAVVMVKAPVE